jgi:phospholipid/cholesterol/gamma-HCH transport system substrate-binding protein
VVSAVALVIIAVGIFLVGSQQRFWNPRVEYWLQFSRTNGLAEGGPVLLDGVNIGSVTSMHFPPDPTAHYVVVRVSVADDVAPRIRRDTVGRIQSLGLLGDKYVELTSGTLETEPVEEGGLIRSFDPVDYEALLGQSGDIVTNVIEVTALLRHVLTDINDGEGLIGRLVTDKDFGRQFAEQLRHTIANLESATARIDNTVARVERGEGALGTLLVEDHALDETLDNLDTASHNMLEFSDRLVNGEGALARLSADREFADKTLGNLQRASSSVAEIADHIRAGHGTLGKLVYDQSLYDDAHRLVGGSGGLWGALWHFVWPFSGKGGSGGTSEAAEPPPRPRTSDARPQDRFRP